MMIDHKAGLYKGPALLLKDFQSFKWLFKALIFLLYYFGHSTMKLIVSLDYINKGSQHHG